MTTISYRTANLLGFGCIAIFIGITFYLQQYDGFIPCPLCILQRITFALLGIMLFLGGAFKLAKAGRFFLSTLATAMSVLGIFLSGRQVWLQHLPPDPNADCGVSLQYLISVLPFDQVIARILHGSAECSQKGWVFMHLSLATWSLLCFIGFFIFCVYQAARALR